MKKHSVKIVALALLSVPFIWSSCKKLTEEVECLFPGNIVLNNITNVSANVSWDKAADAQQYLVEYKKSSDTQFTVLRITSATSTQIINLASGTTYDYRLQSNCPGSSSGYSGTAQFTTKSNNEFNIVKKWRIKFFKENNVQVVSPSGANNDFMDFASGGGLTQSLTISGSPVVTNGTWSLFSNNDSVTVALNTTKKWKISSLSPTDFLLTKNATAPQTTIDSLRFEKF